VGGVHGAGKSTLCAQLRQTLGLTHISPQRVEEELTPVRLDWPDLLHQVRERVSKQLSIGRSFCFEHVMSGHYVRRLIDNARGASFSVQLIYLNVDNADRAVGRVGVRVAAGGHDVDRDQISQRLCESRWNFWQDYRSRADNWHLFENSRRPFEKVANGGQDSRLSISNQDLFDTFLESLEPE